MEERERGEAPGCPTPGRGLLSLGHIGPRGGWRLALQALL